MNIFSATVRIAESALKFASLSSGARQRRVAAMVGYLLSLPLCEKFTDNFFGERILKIG